MPTTVFNHTFTGAAGTPVTSVAPDIGTAFVTGTGSTSPVISNANRGRTSASGATDYVIAEPDSPLADHNYTVRKRVRWMGLGGAGGSVVYVVSHAGGSGAGGANNWPSVGYALKINFEGGSVEGARNGSVIGTYPTNISGLKSSGTLSVGDEFDVIIITASSGSDVTVDFRLQRVSDGNYLQSDGTWGASAVTMRGEGVYSDSSPLSIASGGYGHYDYAGNSVGVHSVSFDVDAASAADTTPPTVSSAATNVSGSQIAVSLSETGCVAAGGGSSGSGGFSLSGTAATVASWSISGATLTLTLSGNVQHGETVTLAYARANTTDDIRDASSNFLADFSGLAVTNNVPPTLDVVVRILQIGDSIYANTPLSGEKISAHVSRNRSLRGHTANVIVVNSAVAGTGVSDWAPGSTNLNNAISASVAAFGAANKVTNPVYVHLRLYANNALGAMATVTWLAGITAIINELLANGFFVVLHGPTFGTGSYGGVVNTRQLAYLAAADPSLIDGVTVFRGERTLYALTEADSTLKQDDIHLSAVGSETAGYADMDGQAGIIYPSSIGVMF